MNIIQIEKNIANLLKNFIQESFVFDLLLSYGEPKASIARLKKGDLNQLEAKGELTLRKKLLFKEATKNLHTTIDDLNEQTASSKQKTRFIIVTDYKTLLAYDTKRNDTLDIKLSELTKHYDFFLPLVGMEKFNHIDENPADVKASNKLAKLYDEILKENPTQTHDEVHALNVFLTRLLFCYFAEDSNIFKENVFTKSISSHTQVDGSDVSSYLVRLFNVFNTSDKERNSSLPEYLASFPYVNGGLFRDKQPVPKFTSKSRNIMIEIGELDWSAINPDIFGSMIQAVVTPEHRGDMGMHYTSVPNIMKVMQPLFLDDLNEELEKSKSSKKKLQHLIIRLSNLKIFDPACGSGNFLIIAYKKIRQLEMEILKAIDDLSGQNSFSFSEIRLTQFYGIELDDFAHEVTVLSLWLAEHQMNLEFFKAFGRTAPSLPLQEGGNIVHGNATRINWEVVCPIDNGDETYILGNPPYAGQKNQNDFQREDIDFVFNSLTHYKRLDYVSCWFYKVSLYLDENSRASFVTTNSICQGTQVEMLWPKIFDLDVEIFFCYEHFKWKNNAQRNAGVTVTIIGLRKTNSQEKYIYKKRYKTKVKNINAYLVDGKNLIINKSTSTQKKLPKMIGGNQPREGGFLILTKSEKNSLVEQDHRTLQFLKRFVGANELINGKERWCIWINENEVNLAYSIPVIATRIDNVKSHRTTGNSVEKSFINVPYRFVTIKQPVSSQIVVPIVSSEERKYVPLAFLNTSFIVSSKAYVIFDAEVYLFGFLQSLMHITWVKAVSARLGNGLSYSAEMCYNTFPFPDISSQQKEDIENLVFNILDEREKNSEKTLAQLYAPEKMPKGLKDAHHQLDLAIEKCYRNKSFNNNEERLEYLFKLYEEMIAKEKN